MVLCNQGCHTHVFFKNGRPYNVLDEQPHKCPMLEMAKMWGGRYNTIPMSYIKDAIFDSYILLSTANASRNIDEILHAVKAATDKLQYVTSRMATKEKENIIWSEQLEDNKARLVADQKKRDEEKRREGQEYESQKTQTPRFTTADRL